MSLVRTYAQTLSEPEPEANGELSGGVSGALSEPEPAGRTMSLVRTYAPTLSEPEPEANGELSGQRISNEKKIEKNSLSPFGRGQRIKYMRQSIVCGPKRRFGAEVRTPPGPTMPKGGSCHVVWKTEAARGGAPPESGGDRKAHRRGQEPGGAGPDERAGKAGCKRRRARHVLLLYHGRRRGRGCESGRAQRAEVSEVGRPERARVEAHGHCVHDGAGFCRGRGPAAPGVRAG